MTVRAGTAYRHLFPLFLFLCVNKLFPVSYSTVWYENLSGVVSCPENSNINTDGLDSVVIGSRDQ